jgi:hypothetical protein
MQIYAYNYTPHFRNTWPQNINGNIDHNLRNKDNFFMPFPQDLILQEITHVHTAKCWKELGATKFQQNKKVTVSLPLTVWNWRPHRSQTKWEVFVTMLTGPSVRYHCGGWHEEVNTCFLNSYMVYL